MKRLSMKVRQATNEDCTSWEGWPCALCPTTDVDGLDGEAISISGNQTGATLLRLDGIDVSAQVGMVDLTVLGEA
jgi:hypothetical protein